MLILSKWFPQLATVHCYGITILSIYLLEVVRASGVNSPVRSDVSTPFELSLR